MSKSIKKIVSITLALAMTAMLFTLALNVNAADGAQVKLVIKNETYPASEGAAWDGVRIDKWVDLADTDSMQTVIENALTAEGIAYDMNSWGYLADIDGLAEYGYNGSGGWMCTLNDWYANEGNTAYTVENGGLKDGDEITVLYTCSWGADVGSLWGNSDTSLAKLTVNGGTLDKDFASADKDYTLTIDAATAKIKLTPEAVNKNYQVKTFSNKYTPAQKSTVLTTSRELEVKTGDTLYIGVGNAAWPTMNDPAKETVYSITVKSNEDFQPELGDVNFDGKVDVVDATIIQKAGVELVYLSDLQKSVADLNGDNRISVVDATAVQKIAAGMVK